MVVNLAVAATLALSVSAASAESARASLDAISTHGSGIGMHVSQNITSNTTWTALGSPYIIIANISVASGATLTIEPGVVVMFQADAFRTLTINGTIRAVATSDANRITFTSLNDDTVAGDVNGGGWSVGEEGDWWHIQISSGNALSEFRYVDIRFGGYGSSPSGYGAIKVTNGSHVTIDHATIADNAQSGVLVGTGSTSLFPGATITNSTITENSGNGVSVNQGWIDLRNSLVAENVKDGLWFNLTSAYTGTPSTVFDSDVSENGQRGIYIQTTSGVAESRIPHGTGNNIYRNNGKQLYHTFYRPNVDWTGNYWGASAAFMGNPSPCFGVSPNSQGHLIYTYSSPDGPISWSQYAASGNVCYYDHFPISATQYSPTLLIHAAGSTGGAGFNSSYYSYNESTCNSEVDPVTVVFHGSATLGQTLDHIEHHTGWTATIFPSQYFLASNQCVPTGGERASGPDIIPSSRHHVRLAQTPTADTILGTTTLGTPHHEDLVWWDPITAPNCDPWGHAVDNNGPAGSGFDQGRLAIFQAFPFGEHDGYFQYKGNTRQFEQCDEDLAGSNGYVLFTRIP